MEESPLSVSAPVGRPIIKRPRLTALLDEAQTAVIMLVAPAGYGKTTLAYEWLGDRDGPSAWHGCSPASADIAALALGIADAAATIVPGAADRLRTRLRVTNEPEREVDILAELLAEDLAPWPADAWLCLDDYQFAIESTASERLVERLLELSPLRILVASRERPTWATPRRILYGELTEIGMSALAMTHDEGEKVLSAREPSHIAGLLALADGWPAVIGLAAMVGDFEVPDDRLPAPLYDYIAEELYQSVPRETQLRLAQLAIAPSVPQDLVTALFGNAARTVIDDAIRLGFVAMRTDAMLDVHPLLRSFLQGKLAQDAPTEERDAALRIARFFLLRRDWDHAFAVAARHHLPEILVSLVRESLDRMLSDGRLPTLSAWLQVDEMPADEPVLQVAEAEVEFRKGQYRRAEALAAQGARQLPSSDVLASRAFFRAGQCAHFLDHPDRAIEYFEAARESALSEADTRHAIWGHFITSLDFGRPDTQELLSQLSSFSNSTIDDSVRHAGARLGWAYRTRGILEELDAIAPIIHVMDKVRDPMIRTSFLNLVASALVMSGRYSEARTTAMSVFAEAEAYRLRFVFPHALVVKACAELGLKRFGSALRTLRHVERLALEHDDLHSQMNAAALRLRLRTVEGSPHRGLREAERGWKRLPGPGMQGELLASRALALACAGQLDEALAAATEAEALTSQPETLVLVSATRAIVAVAENRADVELRLTELLGSVVATGNRDSLLVAFRAFPDLLSAIFRSGKGTLLLRTLDGAEIDTDLATELHPASTSSGPTFEELSPREKEVLTLTAEGLTNREIAKSLFISEVTVKAHLRHIFVKLGVRSRTEAAILVQSRHTATAPASE